MPDLRPMGPGPRGRIQNWCGPQGRRPEDTGSDGADALARRWPLYPGHIGWQADKSNRNLPELLEQSGGSTDMLTSEARKMRGSHSNTHISKTTLPLWKGYQKIYLIDIFGDRAAPISKNNPFSYFKLKQRGCHRLNRDNDNCIQTELYTNSTVPPYARHSGNPLSKRRASKPFSRRSATASNESTQYGPRQYATISLPVSSSDRRSLSSFNGILTAPRWCCAGRSPYWVSRQLLRSTDEPFRLWAGCKPSRSDNRIPVFH